MPDGPSATPDDEALVSDDEVPTPADVFAAAEHPSPGADGDSPNPADVARSPDHPTPKPDDPAPTPDDEALVSDDEVPTPADVFAAPDDPSAVSSGAMVLERADLVAAAVLAVDGVASLHSGTFGEVATYLPRRRVEGIRITPSVTEVHLVLAWGAPVLATADSVRRAVVPLVDTPVDITVQDVVDPLAGAPSAPSLSKETP